MIYYTVPEVALMLHVSKSYVYDIISRGQLKTVRLSERRTRITATSLEFFTEQQMDSLKIKSYNKSVVRPPKRGRKPNGAA
ncbi:excisionase [Desulfosporosinus sp. HMP52]|uniref:helix-turn-helix domain-containing protein n=1 Tax=Desulfosporosinus sp. HMP52 TaxID=1487923 RepID=UPI00051FB99D|nr:helix-turn-helix domain-containing protein [Desulfosporosinus sp. HMP52]KGK81781.1 excisionase [Desulfosporosinus sp. HMP52]